MNIFNISQFKTIILDLDGPLLEGKWRHYQCYADILQGFGFPPLPLQTYWKMKRAQETRHTLLKLSGAEHLYDAFLKEWLARIETPPYLLLDRLQPQVRQILTQWKNTHLQLVLATLRHQHNHLFWQLEKLLLLPFFNKIIPINYQQSKGAAVAAYLKTLGTEMSACLWIGDTEVDSAAARELSMPVTLLSCGLRTKDYLLSLQPDYYYPDLATLAAST